MAAGAARGANPNGFEPSPGARWHDSFATLGPVRVVVGDFNGDRRDDLVSFEGEHVWVLFASPTAPRFEGPVDWNQHPLPPGALPVAGDVDGDGTDDLVYFLRGSGAGDEADDAWALFTDRGGFNTRVRLHDRFCVGDEIPALADVDGDRKADLITFVPGGDGAVWVGLSAGRAPVTDVRPWIGGFLGPGQIPLVADFNGDRRADIAAVLRDTDPAARGHVRVALSREGGFAPPTTWHTHFCLGQEVPLTGDFDGDGASDLITFVRGRPDARLGPADPAGDVYTALASPLPDGRGWDFGEGTLRHAYFCVGEETPLTGDFDGDGKADICTLVGRTASSSSPLFGDVRVALSTHGRESKWEVSLEAVKTVRPTESGGDEPYFILTGFRVRANEPDSAQVWFSGFEAVPWPKDMGPGESVAFPEGACRLVFAGVGAPTVRDLSAGRAPEMIGWVVTAMEKDESSWEKMRGNADLSRRILLRLVMQATRDHPVRAATWARDLGEWFSALNAAPYHAKISGSAATLDDDDWVTMRIFVHPAFDMEGLRRFNSDYGPSRLIERQWRLDADPLVMESPWSTWHVEMRLRRPDPK